MNTNKFLNILVLTTTVALASCGGGGDVGDGTVELTASPNKIDLSTPFCSFAQGPTITVYGGIAPYRIRNPYPAYIQLSKDYLQSADDRFTFTVRGACLDKIPLLILDNGGHSIEFLVSVIDNAPKK
jgi:hypothetical protein